MLKMEEFTNLIETAPLVSIDLIIRGESGYLLGMRNNQPAKGNWFVPGGRIFKNETISHAIKRISTKEIGVEVGIKDADFYGVFEHFYDNSFISSKISTHYIVLAYSFSNKNSARYDPSCPVIPVINAFFIYFTPNLKNNLLYTYECHYCY